MNEAKPKRDKTNWSRLAFELIVVVLGILIALGIDSWWSNRQDLHLERALLEQLHTDLVRAEEQLSRELAEAELTAGAASKLVSVAWGELAASWDSTAAWMRRTTIYTDPVPTVATAQAIAAGDLHLVRSDPLRAAVVDHVDRIRQLDIRVLPYERELNELVRSLTGLIHPRYWSGPASVGTLDGEVEGFVESGFGAPVPDQPDAVLLGDEFSLLAYEIFWVHEDLRWLLAQMLKSTVELRERLEEEYLA